jgi:voltage-gated sodium channel
MSTPDPSSPSSSALTSPAPALPPPAPARDTPMRRVVESGWFNAASVAVIVVTGAVLGAESYLDRASVAFAVCEWVMRACVALFIVECACRFVARESTRSFLRDPWNIFDLVIIAAALVPAQALGDLGPLAPILRILRVLRVLRLVRSVPELRLIVEVLARSVVSMKWIGVLSLLSFYIFAIIGNKLFGAYQPEYWGSLHESFFTLFRCLTGDDWTQLRYEAYGKVQSTQWFITVFYVTWIVLGTFILINLVVGAIINNYQEVQDVEQARQRARQGQRSDYTLSDEHLAELVRQLHDVLERRRHIADHPDAPAAARPVVPSVSPRADEAPRTS